jgi:hypothetical protein
VQCDRIYNSVSDEPAVSGFRMEKYPEDGGRYFLRCFVT